MRLKDSTPIHTGSGKPVEPPTQPLNIGEGWEGRSNGESGKGAFASRVRD